MYPFALSHSFELCNMSSCNYNQGCNFINHTISHDTEKTFNYDEFRPLYNTETKHNNVCLMSVPLDTILYQFKNPVSVIKIDVEGFELHVLKGASIFLDIHRPIVIIEIWDIHIDDVFLFMREKGYTTHQILYNTEYNNKDYIFYPNPT